MKNKKGENRGVSMLVNLRRLEYVDQRLLPPTLDLSNVKQVMEFLERAIIIPAPKIHLIKGGVNVVFQMSYTEAQKFLEHLRQSCLFERTPCGKSAPKKRKRK